MPQHGAIILSGIYQLAVILADTKIRKPYLGGGKHLGSLRLARLGLKAYYTAALSGPESLDITRKDYRLITDSPGRFFKGR